MKEQIDPPAIVRSVEDVGELRRKIRDCVERTDRYEKAALDDAVEAGQALLKLRPTCPRGTWLQTLVDLGVPQQRASDWIRIGKLPRAVVSTCSSVREAVEKARGLGVTAETEMSELLNTTQKGLGNFADDETNYQPGKQSDFTLQAAPPDPRCDRCQRVGLQSCDKCVSEVELAQSKGWSVDGGWPGFGPAAPAQPAKTETAPKADQPKPPEPPKPPYAKPPTGGFDMRSVIAHAGSLKRHVGNMYVDHGLVDQDGLPIEDEWLVNFIKDDRALVERIKKRRKELKSKKE